MPDIIEYSARENRSSEKSASHSLGKRLLWFVGLWLAGVGTVSALAYGLRWWLGV